MNTAKKATTGKEHQGHRTDRILDLLVFAVAGELARTGLDRDQAATHARQAVVAVCQMVGGDYIYIPRETRIPRTETAARVLQEWRAGKRTDEIAVEMGLTDRWVRKLLTEAREANSLAPDEKAQG
jgi:Mor family transcriptional regulator